jgi:hypothetical protein
MRYLSQWNGQCQLRCRAGQSRRWEIQSEETARKAVMKRACTQAAQKGMKALGAQEGLEG